MHRVSPQEFHPIQAEAQLLPTIYSCEIDRWCERWRSSASMFSFLSQTVRDRREIFFREVSQSLALAPFEHSRLPVLSGLPLLYEYIAGTPIVTQSTGWV